MKALGSVDTGIQQTTKGELELRAGSSTVAKVDANGFSNEVGVFRNRREISTSISIATDESAVLGGPVTITSTGTLTINGNGILVIV